MTPAEIARIAGLIDKQRKAGVSPPRPAEEKKPPKRLATPQAACRYLGQRVGTIDCKCQRPKVLYACNHPEQKNEPAFCVSAWNLPGTSKATYDAGATDEIKPASCVTCKLREPIAK
jgi:hypothetical protein